MNIYNNIKFIQDHKQVHKLDIFSSGKRISTGAILHNKKGKRILQTYPVRHEGSVVYMTTQWNDDGELMYKQSKLRGTQVSRLIKNLLNIKN